MLALTRKTVRLMVGRCRLLHGIECAFGSSHLALRTASWLRLRLRSRGSRLAAVVAAAAADVAGRPLARHWACRSRLGGRLEVLVEEVVLPGCGCV